MKIGMIGLRSITECTGGVERHVRELAKRFVKQGHDVTVFCRDRYSKVDNFEGVSIVNHPAIYTKRLESVSHTARALPDLLGSFHITHFHACGPALFAWIPRALNRNVVATVHGLDFLRDKWGALASRFLRAGAWSAAYCPRETIVVSRPLQRYYWARYRKLATYIPNGIEPPDLRPLRRLRRFDLREKEYALFLGRLVPEKGAHLLIEAFKRLDVDLRLVIAGDAHHMDGYRRQLRETAAGDSRIIFTGPLFGEEKDEAFTNARLFVMPSTLEGMPITLLEALAYGVPILTSDIPECLDVFRAMDGTADEDLETSGLYSTFRSNDVDSLEAALALALGRTQSEVLRQKGQELARCRYDWDLIAEKTLLVYEDCLRHSTVNRALPRPCRETVHGEMNALPVSTQVRRGLERDEFLIHLQPIFSLKPARVRSMEALLRWRPSGDRLLYPRDFLSRIHDLETLSLLERWKIERLLIMASELDQIDPGVTFSLNIALPCLTNETARRDILAALAGQQRQQSIKVEIKEGDFVRNATDVAKAVEILGAQGVGVIMDNAGKNVDQLFGCKKLLFEGVKMDAFYYLALRRTGRGEQSILRQLTRLIEDAGKDLIIEKVERPLEWESLAEARRCQAQGYLLGKPMSFENLKIMLGLQQLAEAPRPAAAVESDRPPVLTVHPEPDPRQSALSH